MDHYPLSTIRANYAALTDVCYLNTGTVGILSETVLLKHLDRISSYERMGHLGEADARAGYEEARREIASVINCDPTELALTRNATDGVNLVLASVDAPDGCSLITTDQEHPAVMLPMTALAQRMFGSVDLIPLSGSDDEILSRFQALLDDRNIFMAVIGHVSCETGRRLPIAEMCHLCRERGVLSLVDGAQSVGQIDVDVHDIGCDFMTGNGHKWLCGPKGTGFLYVHRDLVHTLTPPFVGDGAIEPSFDREWYAKAEAFPELNFRGDARRFEFGTRSWHHFGALADAIREWRALDPQLMQQHVASVSDYLKHSLAARPGITLHTPDEWKQSSGLVTFAVEGWEGTNLSQRLWHDFGIIQRRVQQPSAVRVSCAHFTSREDIDRLLNAVDEILAEEKVH